MAPPASADGAPPPRGALRPRVPPRRVPILLAVLALLTGCASPGSPPAAAPTGTTAEADAVMRIVADTMARAHLKSVLVRVTVAGEEVLTHAMGESMTGVPATTAMHFRNGAVAISYVATLLLVATDLRGRTRAQPGCATCAPQTNIYTYGLGIVISGDWLLQNPMFGGYAAIAAYLPAREIAIAVAVTYDQTAFDPQGNYDNVADSLFRKIGAQSAPGAAPPQPTVK